MAKKKTIPGENLLHSLDDPWGGQNNTESEVEVYGETVPAGSEWGMNRGEVERFVKGKLSEHDMGISNSLKGVRVNNAAVPADGNGVVDLYIPTVDESLNPDSTNPVQNAAVASNINSLNAAKVGGMHTEPHPSDPDSLMLIIDNENGDEVASCAIPKASEIEIGRAVQQECRDPRDRQRVLAACQARRLRDTNVEIQPLQWRRHSYWPRSTDHHHTRRERHDRDLQRGTE